MCLRNRNGPKGAVVRALPSKDVTKYLSIYFVGSSVFLPKCPFLGHFLRLSLKNDNFSTFSTTIKMKFERWDP